MLYSRAGVRAAKEILGRAAITAVLAIDAIRTEHMAVAGVLLAASTVALARVCYGGVVVGNELSRWVRGVHYTHVACKGARGREQCGRVMPSWIQMRDCQPVKLQNAASRHSALRADTPVFGTIDQ